VITAGDQLVTGESHVGIGEAQERRPFAPLRVVHTLAVVFLFGIIIRIRRRYCRRQSCRVLRIEESGWFRQHSDQLEVHDGLAGIHETRRKSGTGVGGQIDQHCIHALDFGCLIVRHVVGELEQHRIVCRTRLLQQFLDHLHRALMMINHQGQKQAIKIGTLKCSELSHLLRAGHAGHIMRGVHRRMRSRLRHRLTAIPQPALHEIDFIDL